MAIALAFNIPIEQLRRTEDYERREADEMKKVATEEDLINEWKKLKTRAGICDIGALDWPDALDRDS